MNQFEEEINKILIDEVISTINILMGGVNIYITEAIIGKFHRKIMNHPKYVTWVVSKLLKCENVTTTKLMTLLDDKSQITPAIMLGYYKNQFKYELNRNQSVIAKKINNLRLEQNMLDKFVEDYNSNSSEYGTQLANVLDKPELFRYILDFIRV